MYNIMNYNVMTINVKKDITSINDFLNRYVIANKFNSLTHVFELIKEILQLHIYYKIKYICRVNLSYTCIYLKLVVTLELSKVCYLCQVLIFISVMYCFFLFFIFIHNKGINIHMTYNNNDNKQSEIITLSLCL